MDLRKKHARHRIHVGVALGPVGMKVVDLAAIFGRLEVSDAGGLLEPGKRTRQHFRVVRVHVRKLGEYFIAYGGMQDWKVQQVKNWFVPFPQIRGHQKDIHISPTPKGDLLCAFAAVGKQYESDGKHYLARSQDKGRTWTVQESPENLRVARIDLPGDTYYYGDIRLFRDGRLVALKFGTPGGGWTESKDDGKTWSKSVAIKIDGLPKDPIHIGTSWQLELKDETLLRFALGRHSTNSNPITKWGAAHVQAFSTRSTDGGRTWSLPVNLDTSRNEMGNLDLT